MSLFVSFEGGEGSGKTTQADELVRRLADCGIPALLVHEPGSTRLGDYLRPWVKREESLSHAAELFLFAASRAQLVAEVIRPALESNKVVVADRYADSTVAYQGYGRRLNLRHVRAVNALATQGVMPDLTFLLDCSSEESFNRLGPLQQPILQMRLSLDPSARGEPVRVDEEGQTRFENEPMHFHRRVREGYLKMASSEPDRWCVIDATRPPGEISGIVCERVKALLGERAR